MKTIKLLLLLFISTLIITSCKKDEVEEDTISKLGFIKTAVLNDENEDGFAQIGETITYTFDIKNTGDNTISNIVINDERIDIFDLALDPSSLAAGESATIEVNYTITFSDAGEEIIINQATVSGKDDIATSITDLSDDDSYDEDNQTVTSFDLSETGPYANGYFIINEGNFGLGNTSLTFVSLSGAVTHNVYNNVNGEALGDTAQSMYFYGANAYIVLNGSHKVIVTNRNTMEKIAVIDGESVNNPRFLVAVGTTGYLTNWGVATDATDDFISVIDLDTNTIITTIPVGEGPEEMLVSDDKVYVNLQGGWGQNNQVVVIDATSNAVTTSIEVSDVPNSILKDASGNIWVLCGGTPSWAGTETAGNIIQIRDDEVYSTHELYTSQHPTHMTIDGSSLYFHMNGKVYSRSATTFGSIDEVSGFDGYYYGMQANSGKLYTLDAVDYSSEGVLRVFDLATTSLETTISTGIIPNGVAFNY